MAVVLTRTPDIGPQWRYTHERRSLALAGSPKPALLIYRINKSWELIRWREHAFISGWEMKIG